MVRLSWKVYTALALLGLSILLATGHILFFEDAPTLFFYLALDIVFVPVQVLLVTLIIERLLNERERQAMIKKLNMVIGAFMSEVGGDFHDLPASGRRHLQQDYPYIFSLSVRLNPFNPQASPVVH